MHQQLPHGPMHSVCRVHFSAAEQQRTASPLLMPCTPQMGAQHTQALPYNGPASAAQQQAAGMPSS